tara:strand:- start:802 stop:942 length:141 start_codon:yes stop_codon:yes gene_type:complete
MNRLSCIGISTLLLSVSVASLSAGADAPYQAFIDKPDADTAFQYIH